LEEPPEWIVNSERVLCAETKQAALIQHSEAGSQRLSYLLPWSPTGSTGGVKGRRCEASRGGTMLTRDLQEWGAECQKNN
jgi:hypothetical protein